MGHPARGAPGGRRRPLEGASIAVICRALAAVGLTDQARRLRIRAAWAEAVGPQVAARAQPELFRRGILVVRAASSTWQHELTYLRAGIIERLNQCLGGPVVQGLKVVGGTLSPPAEPEEVEAEPPPLPAGDLAAARALAAPVACPTLREACARAVAAGRRRAREQAAARRHVPAG